VEPTTKYYIPQGITAKPTAADDASVFGSARMKNRLFGIWAVAGLFLGNNVTMRKRKKKKERKRDEKHLWFLFVNQRLPFIEVGAKAMSSIGWIQNGRKSTNGRYCFASISFLYLFAISYFFLSLP
jgi:hypothetical protein